MPQTPAAGHALVTGASSGIGLAIAERLLADGWQVTGLARRAAPIMHRQFCMRRSDLADPIARQSGLADLTGLTALVHAAGVMRSGPLGELDVEAGAEMWRLNVDAAAFLADRLTPQLPDGGRIVLIGSRLSAGFPRRSQYAASKAALVGLARSWAVELVGRGITVNVVAPGATDTPMLRDSRRGAEPPRVPPIGRVVQPEEVAATVAFLLSSAAATITGQQIVMCGGASL